MQEKPPEAIEPQPESRMEAFETPLGKVFVRTHCPESLVVEMSIDDGIGLFFHYRKGSGLEQREVLRKIAQMPDGNVVLAFTEAKHVVGYIAMHAVSEGLRWGRGDTTGYYEFGAIEVSRNFRGAKLANHLVDIAFVDEWLEDKIVVSYEFSWHWDLEALDIGKRRYRQLLQNLLGRAGFREFPTDEPNIRMDPNNLFSVRIGSRVSPQLYDKFLASLFTGKGPDAWAWPARW